MDGVIGNISVSETEESWFEAGPAKPLRFVRIAGSYPASGHFCWYCGCRLKILDFMTLLSDKTSFFLNNLYEFLHKFRIIPDFIFSIALKR